MTPAPAPSPCGENGCTDIDNCDEICDHSRVYSPVQMRQAAAQAREELFEAIKAEYDPVTESVDWDSIEAAYIRCTEAHP